MGSIRHEITSLERLEERGVKLRKLDNIADNIGGYYRIVAKDEINNTRRKCLEDGGEEYGIEVKEGAWPAKAARPVNERNFIAHAGMERNVTEGRVVGGEVYIRYRSGGWSVVRGLLNKVISA